MLLDISVGLNLLLTIHASFITGNTLFYDTRSFDTCFAENEVHGHVLLAVNILSGLRFGALIKGKAIQYDWTINLSEFFVFLFLRPACVTLSL